MAIIDRDGPGISRFWNLSAPQHTMYGQASALRAFRLMPIHPKLAPQIRADWSFKILDRSTRTVAFHDDTTAAVTARRWDFGDGETATDAAPVHRYARPGKYVVVLQVTGPTGHSALSKVWDVSFVGDPPK
ncbi:PKD domain-containing protein [Sphingomonas sp. PB2P19]|uniref:PKD domain-containing protein n=1 Tax=Sphingomonas rhamnosi TaxID=3096156 RepID=UPI002FC73F39